MSGLSTIVANVGRKFFSWTLAADSSGTGNFFKACSGMRSFSTAQMARIAKTHEYAS
jgi:hypothetical protein